MTLHRAKRHTLGIELTATGVTAKVISVKFHKNFIFLLFAHHPRSTGVLKLVSVAPGREASFNLAEQGGVTSHHIKYSHPIDGRAHFSQDKMIRTKFFAQASRLDTYGGHLFSLDVRGLARFEPYLLEAPEPCVRVLGVEEPASGGTIHIAGYWHPVTAETDWSMRGNPVTMQRAGGAPITGLAVAPPEGSPLQDHILFFNVCQRPLKIDSEAEFDFIFIGGFDANLTDHTKEASFLALAYPAPANSAADLLDFLPDVDAHGVDPPQDVQP